MGSDCGLVELDAIQAMRDAFGLFRGWCRTSPSCLEYRVATEQPAGPADMRRLRCTRCQCLPQEHVATVKEGYNPHSERHYRERRRFDARLLSREDAIAHHKAAGDDAFRHKNFRTAYESYGEALALAPDDHVLLGNRSLAYLRVGRLTAALADAERAAALAPAWPKAAYRRGCCLRALERFDDAVAAFALAAELDPGSRDAQQQLEAARRDADRHESTQRELAVAREQTTQRQASALRDQAEYEARMAAVRAGKMDDYHGWSEEERGAWAARYEREKRAPAGVEYALRSSKAAEEAEEAEEEEEVEGGDAEGGLVLEDNAAGNDDETGGGDAAAGAAGVLALPPRNYTLVHEDGRVHSRDAFEPMGFGMRQVHYARSPEPVWVQTPSARWMQAADTVTVIAHRVPAEACSARRLRVEIASRQLHVACRLTGEVWLHGELERGVGASASTWLTDGAAVTISLVKLNLQLYVGASDGGERTTPQTRDTHWERLLTSDQYVERGMVDADYAELPREVLHEERRAEEKRKADDAEKRRGNRCPLCGEDARFFCDCRARDADYRRPIPDGWKSAKHGLGDDHVAGYSLAEPTMLKRPPPPQPAPYRGSAPG